MLKLTLVVCSIFSDLMAETIWVRFSAGGAAVAVVAALPVVVLCDLVVSVAWDLVVSAGLLVWAFMLPLLLSVAPLVSAFMLPVLESRPSAFMPLAPLVVSVSELMLFDFSPAGDLVSCALLLDGILSWD